MEEQAAEILYAWAGSTQVWQKNLVTLQVTWGQQVIGDTREMSGTDTDGSMCVGRED